LKSQALRRWGNSLGALTLATDFFLYPSDKELQEKRLPKNPQSKFETAIPSKQMLPTDAIAMLPSMLPNHRPMLPIRARMLPICVVGWQHIEGALNTHGTFCVIYLSFSLWIGKEMATWYPRFSVVTIETILFPPVETSERNRYLRIVPRIFSTREVIGFQETRCGYDSYSHYMFFLNDFLLLFA